MSANLNFSFANSFPKDFNYRLAWHADITQFSPRGGFTPMIQVVFERITPCENAFLNTNQYDVISVPVAYLRLFRIGDLWREGRQYGSDPTSITATFDLNVTSANIEIAPVGLPIKSSAGQSIYPLPFEFFDAHKHHTGSYCARIAITNDTTLVIPCTELVRFYFGASGGLLKRIFSGTVHARELYTSARFSKDTGTGMIDLCEGIPGVAASTIGRIAFDSHARKAFHWLINSGMSAAANRQRHFPKTTFPFEGSTDLTVQGKWITTDSHRVFLAEQLLTCTHPFPFKSLYYTSSSGMIKASSKPAVAQSVSSPIAVHAKGIQLSDNPISDILTPVGLNSAMNSDLPFPDLEKKSIKRIKYPHSFSKKHESLVSELGAGEQRSTSQLKGAEINDAALDELVITGIEQSLSSIATEVKLVGSQLGDRISLKHPSNHSPINGFLSFEDLFPNFTIKSSDVWAVRMTFDLQSYSSSVLILAKQEMDVEGKLREILCTQSYDPHTDINSELLKQYIRDFVDHRQFWTGLRDSKFESQESFELDNFWSLFTSLLGRDTGSDYWKTIKL